MIPKTARHHHVCGSSILASLAPAVTGPSAPVVRQSRHEDPIGGTMAKPSDHRASGRELYQTARLRIRAARLRPVRRSPEAETTASDVLRPSRQEPLRSARLRPETDVDGVRVRRSARVAASGGRGRPCRALPDADTGGRRARSISSPRLSPHRRSGLRLRTRLRPDFAPTPLCRVSGSPSARRASRLTWLLCRPLGPVRCCADTRSVRPSMQACAMCA